MIYWFTGQPGHGKTTLAKALIAHLRAQGTEPFHVDGDDLRALTANADYSRAGREACKRRDDRGDEVEAVMGGAEWPPPSTEEA